MNRGHTAWSITAVALSTLALAGCGSSHSGGNAAASAASTAAAPRLDTGKFRTTPQPDFGTVVDAKQGAVIEGQRMAEYVIHPMDADVNLSDSQMGDVPSDLDGLAGYFGGAIPKSIAGDHYVTGFATEAKYPNKDRGRDFTHLVMRFADPASAQRAVTDLHHAMVTLDWNTPADGSAPTLTPGIGTEDHISTLPNSLIDTRTDGDDFVTEAVTVHGPYVFFDRARAIGGSGQADSATWAAQTITAAVAQQEPKIDQFPATPVDQLAKLPVDVDGVLRLTLPTDPNDLSNVEQAVYGANGFLHFAADPVQEAPIVRAAGMDRYATAGSHVYRTTDAAGATTLIDGLGKVDAHSMHPGPAVPGVPGSRCWVAGDGGESWTTCFVSRGRFVSEVTAYGAPGDGSDVTTAHQMAAAEYEVLAGAN